MMKPSEILATAAALIEPIGAWCQRAAARNASGASVGATSKQACSFCIAGAIERACAPNGFSLAPMEPALTWIRKVLAKRDPSIRVGSAGAIANWQDAEERTQNEAHSLIEEAHRAALEEGE